MDKTESKSLSAKFETFATAVTRATGHPLAFIIAFLIVLVWGISGPLFGFSDTWQLVINTGTTIVTFLMVFLIQLTQNKDSEAIQIKLNEVVAALKGASNRLINVEDLSEADLQKLHEYYNKLSELAKQEKDISESHSVEEAEEKHEEKESQDKKTS
jgi:low affinity Fe/Cu permease